MVSTYGYATLVNLELHAKRDYSTIDAVFLADAYVEDTISDAEKFINGYVGTIWTATIPPDIELITKMIAKIFLDNFMIEKGLGNMSEANGNVIIDVLERYDIILILNKYKDQYSDVQGVFITKHRMTHNPRRSFYWP